MPGPGTPLPPLDLCNELPKIRRAIHLHVFSYYYLTSLPVLVRPLIFVVRAQLLSRQVGEEEKKKALIVAKNTKKRMVAMRAPNTQLSPPAPHIYDKKKKKKNKVVHGQ
jgi:hypothetical protein